VPFQTPNDPRAHMRGRDFHTFASSVVLTRGPVPAPYPYLVFDEGYQTLDVLADGVTPQAVQALQVSIAQGDVSVPGLWRVYGRGAALVHYDGPDDAVAAVERVRDAGLWFWSIAALDDAPAEATLCARVPRAHTPRHLKTKVGALCVTGGGKLGPDAAWTAGDCTPYPDPGSVPCARVPRAHTPRHLRHTSGSVCYPWGRVGPNAAAQVHVRHPRLHDAVLVPWDSPTWCAPGPWAPCVVVGG